jgi:hypothetical protein
MNILAAYRKIKNRQLPLPMIPELWDGQAAERIAKVIVSFTV